MKNLSNFDKGQHFLTSKEILKKEIEISNLTKTDKVLEIGAGTGILTNELCKKAGKVFAFETDRQFQPELEKIKKEFSNLTITFDDALNYDWKNYTKIVSNIPYYLSEPIILKAMQEKIPELILIIGERFKELLISEKKLGKIAQKFYRITPIIKINSDAFSPQPKTNSWLIKLEKKQNISEKDKFLISVCLKKGKIKNAIIHSLIELGKTKKQSRNILSQFNLSEQTLEKPAIKITSKLLNILEEKIYFLH